MGDGFDPYHNHVPQRARDKLIITNRFPNFHLQGLLPIYDPPSLYSPSSDFITFVGRPGSDNHHNNILVCKEEIDQFGGGSNFLGGYSGANPMTYMMDHPRSSSSSSLHHLNPSEIDSPFLYNHQQHTSYKFGGDLVVCGPPPSAAAVGSMNACNHGLSLSLSSSHNHATSSNNQQLPSDDLELNLQNYEHDSSIYTKKMQSFAPHPQPAPGGGGSTSTTTGNELSRNSVPLGPFTGYASVLKGSRFLGPAQQLLEEICDVGDEDGNVYPEKLSADTVMLDPSMENLAKNVDDHSSSSQQSCNLGSDQRRKKSRLMLLLNEVYKRYKQYCHQMQAVVASFESVAGVKNAAPFASMAVKAMSKHFNFLKNVISDQLQQFLTEPHNAHNLNVVSCQDKDVVPLSTYDASSATGVFDFVPHQPAWRPQRGLPERAVNVLRAWLFDHFLHPYPTDTDKLMLAKQTGLSRNQVSNWFINARVRLWKPMVEEIHMLETRQAQKSSHEEAVSNVVDGEDIVMIHGASNTATTIPVSSLKTATFQEDNNIMPLKRARNEPMETEKNALLLMDRRNYENISAFPQMGFGGVSSGGGANGGVSLTLGLQQNNSGSSTRLTDPFTVSAARRLGLVDPNGEEYVASGGWH